MATYQDGNFPSGSPILTSVGGNTYVCNDFSIDKAAETVPILDQNGAPSGALQFEGFRTGSAQLQFAAANTVEPTTAAANSSRGVFVNVNIDGANVNIFATSVGIQKPQRGPWIATVAWQARVNA